ncbi:MAG: hypothetical protein IT486_04180 [Gammaproteobacteria bacterium]|nr:hypothetical protein [Gammaproteobacteria bacterium]
MKRKTAVLATITVLLVNVAVAADWKKELAGPLVQSTGGKMIYQELELCSMPTESGPEPTSFQVRTRSEAPKDQFISRDYFVAITASMIVEVVEQMGEPDCKTLDTAIGHPDIEINIYMAVEGMQVEIANTGTGEKSRSTVRWEDLFAD